MYYQLANGKIVTLSVDQFLELTDEDVQYLMSIDYGDYITDPFTGSAVENTSKKEYDFSFISVDDESVNDIVSDDLLFDDIIDLEGPLDN